MKPNFELNILKSSDLPEDHQANEVYIKTPDGEMRLNGNDAFICETFKDLVNAKGYFNNELQKNLAGMLPSDFETMINNEYKRIGLPQSFTLPEPLPSGEKEDQSVFQMEFLNNNFTDKIILCLSFDPAFNTQRKNLYLVALRNWKTEFVHTCEITVQENLSNSINLNNFLSDIAEQIKTGKVQGNEVWSDPNCFGIADILAEKFNVSTVTMNQDAPLYQLMTNAIIETVKPKLDVPNINEDIFQINVDAAKAENRNTIFNAARRHGKSTAHKELLEQFINDFPSFNEDQKGHFDSQVEELQKIMYKNDSLILEQLESITAFMIEHFSDIAESVKKNEPIKSAAEYIIPLLQELKDRRDGAFFPAGIPYFEKVKLSDLNTGNVFCYALASGEQQNGDNAYFYAHQILPNSAGASNIILSRDLINRDRAPQTENHLSKTVYKLTFVDFSQFAPPKDLFRKLNLRFSKFEDESAAYEKDQLFDYFKQFLNGTTGLANADVLADICLLIQEETEARIMRRENKRFERFEILERRINIATEKIDFVKNIPVIEPISQELKDKTELTRDCWTVIDALSEGGKDRNELIALVQKLDNISEDQIFQAVAFLIENKIGSWKIFYNISEQKYYLIEDSENAEPVKKQISMIESGIQDEIDQLDKMIVDGYKWLLLEMPPSFSGPITTAKEILELILIKYNTALNLLDRAMQEDFKAPDPNWFNDYCNLKQQYAVLTEEGWCFGEVAKTVPAEEILQKFEPKNSIPIQTEIAENPPVVSPFKSEINTPFSENSPFAEAVVKAFENKAECKYCGSSIVFSTNTETNQTICGLCWHNEEYRTEFDRLRSTKRFEKFGKVPLFWDNCLMILELLRLGDPNIAGMDFDAIYKATNIPKEHLQLSLDFMLNEPILHKSAKPNVFDPRKLLFVCEENGKYVKESAQTRINRISSEIGNED